MSHVEKRYRGKPPGGLTAVQVAVVAVVVLIAILAMTMKVNSQWSGKSCGEQLYEALFETEDWS